MSQPCSTCGPAGKKQEDEQLASIRIKAKKHAEEKKIPVAIYKENGEWQFTNAFTAAAQGYPLDKVVSHNYNAPPL